MGEVTTKRSDRKTDVFSSQHWDLSEYETPRNGQSFSSYLFQEINKPCATYQGYRTPLSINGAAFTIAVGMNAVRSMKSAIIYAPICAAGILVVDALAIATKYKQ